MTFAMNKLHNADCMEAMPAFPDKFFDLAIVDPPYGIAGDSAAPSRISRYGQLRTANFLKPTPAYFAELFRVSKNQIVWGYNHLSDMLPPTREFVFWYKHQPVESYSDGELAWTSFGKTAKCFDYPFFGSTGADKNRFHPTQKPVALYRWLLKTYGKDGDVILDTHAGSAACLVAAWEMGFGFVGFEIDPAYYGMAARRLADVQSQGKLFDVS